MQPSGRNNLRTIALLILSGLGLITSFFLAAILWLFGLIGVFGQAVPLDDVAPVFALGWIAALVGLLALPAVVYCVLRLLGRTWHLPKLGSGYRLASILILLWPLFLAAGNYIARMNQLAWLLLPPLALLAVGLPIWWLVETARHRLPGGSPQRGWGILSTSMFVTMPSVVLVEMLGLLLLAVVLILAISAVPAWADEIQRFAQRLSLLENDPEAILQSFQPLLQNPLTILLSLGILAGIVPMIEELLKPLAIWFLVGRGMRPLEGFAAGAICGGTFALLESLVTLSSAQGEGWAGLAIARAGTGLLHIATSALVGWGLASAWAEPANLRAYLRLLLAYGLAVTWHGLWNALSVVSGIGSLIDAPPPEVAWLTRLSPAAPLALVVLVVCLFLFLWGSNRRLRKTGENLVLSGNE